MNEVRYLLSTGAEGLSDPLAGLNPQQCEAVCAPAGPVLIVAGAGTGKTRTLTHRLAWLLMQGVPPAAVALCTFTNKAAREMLERVAQLAPAGARQVWGGTFHHLANRLLREFAERAGYRRDYGILDAEDTKELWEQVLAEPERNNRRATPLGAGLLRELVSLSVNTLVPLERVVLERAPHLLERLDEILALAREFGERKVRMNVMDFDDLLFRLFELLESDAQLAQEIGERFQQVLVDEYQDTNLLQVKIIDRLAAVHGNLTVVGDDAQAIYGFRGASPEYMLDFEQRWPGARLYRLERNYRSFQPILDVANRCLACARTGIPKVLAAVRQGGERPVRVLVRDVERQAAFVAQRVLELHQEGVALSDMAVLYRAHSHSLELQLELARRAIPFAVRSGVRFFEQAHIKDVLAYLRLLDNPRDELAWRRVLKLQAGIGARGAERTLDWLRAGPDPLQRVLAEERPPLRNLSGWERLRQTLRRLAELRSGPPGPLIQAVLAGGYGELLTTSYPDARERQEDIEQLAAYAGHFGNLREMLAELHLLGEFGTEPVGPAGRPQDRLVLSTVHQAKGLEWRCVFVIELREGRFPHSLALREAQGEEEERRLFYVAVTRARDQLYLVYPQMAEYGGGRYGVKRPSRFLKEVEAETERWLVSEQ